MLILIVLFIFPRCELISIIIKTMLYCYVNGFKNAPFSWGETTRQLLGPGPTSAGLGHVALNCFITLT